MTEPQATSGPPTVLSRLASRAAGCSKKPGDRSLVASHSLVTCKSPGHRQVHRPDDSRDLALANPAAAPWQNGSYERAFRGLTAAAPSKQDQLVRGREGRVLSAASPPRPH